MEEELEARAAQFVGRKAARAHFVEMLSRRSRHRILLVHGIGGIGKTELLRAFARDAKSKRVKCHFVDARDHAVGEGADSVRSILDAALGAREHGAITAIFIDGAELLTDVDDALCEQLLRRARPSDRIVISGRARPGPAWRQLSLWGRAVTELPLRGLSRDESTKLLALRGVPAKARARALDFGRGHPLALMLMSDAALADSSTSLETLAPPDVVAALTRTLASRIEKEEHRTALEISAIARTTSEPLLTSVLGEKGHDSFEWLRARSFMEPNADGVSPHDLAREAIEADLLWRNPPRYRELLVKIFRESGARLSVATARDAQRQLTEFGYLTRKIPGLSNVFEVPVGVDLVRDRPKAADVAEMTKWVERHESKEAAAAFEHWYAVQPSAFHILRDTSGAPVVVACILALERTSEGERRKDAGVQSTWHHATSLLGKSPKGPVLMVRFLVDRDVHQDPSPAIAAIAAVIAEPLVRMRTLPLYYHYYARFADWELPLRLAGARLAEGAEFEIGRKKYVVSFHDRRVAAPGTWAAEVAERMLAHGEPADTRRDARAASSSLDAEAFKRAVRSALKKLHDIAALEKSDLAGAHVVATHRRANAGAKIRDVLIDEIEKLRGTSRDDSLYRAIRLAYVTPALSQHIAAHTMRVAYGTYRRHLDASIERVIATLWAREQAAT